MNRFTPLSRSTNASSECQGFRLSGYLRGEAKNAHSTYSLPAVLKRAAVAIGAAAIAFLMAAALPVAAQTASTKFIPTFLLYHGGGPALVATDAAKLAKFDLIDIDRVRYNNIGPNTWAAIKSLNPNAQIYLYEMGPEAPSHLDGAAQVDLNGLGRHNVSRAHPQGTLNGGNPGLFQVDASGKRIYNLFNSNSAANQYWYLMDFGSAAYQSYWLDAVKADIVNQPWVADGVFADNCLTSAGTGRYSRTSAWYSTNATWSAAMDSFAGAITAGLRGVGQKLWCNRGETRTVDGSAAWKTLDNSASPPDVIFDEGVFAVQYGSWAVQFYQEAQWKRQVDIMGAIKNSKVAMLSHTKLLEGQAGTDNYGKSVTYWQTLWYSLGSFLLGKNDQLNNTYFMFSGGSGYNNISWHDEYDKIDLGKAIGPYAATTIGSAKVYWREFEKGYVYVNPSAFNATSVSLPQASKRLTHDNLLSPPASVANVNAIALKSHDAAILLKSDTTAPSVPTGLTGTAVSATQINLAWNASTDNVGVTGYRVYVNNAMVGTTSTTLFQHTGLVAGTTYNYRVSAYDAVPNHSALTATPVLVTTTSAPDTQAPSVPIGLTGTAISATQVNLTWTASTDNVGVTGYQVFLNNVVVGTTATTSFQNTGLTAGTTYNYRVNAFDAASNYSGWTATPVSVTTTSVSDTQAPSVPAGLTGTAVSATQVNLTWTASTDNVGVTGYQVFLNNVVVGTTATTSFQNTGLTAGTTYNYRVNAFDAASNYSGWTVTPVSVTPPGTAPGSDTTAPSIPTGLTGTAVSATQINLTWNASTDNVGVTGYYVYLNDVALATTTTTSMQYAGLAAGTTYNFRVSAYDAVPNHGAWNAAPVSVTTPAAPGQPPGSSQTATFSSTTAEFPNPERGISRMYSELAGLPSSWLTAHRDAGYRLVTHRQLLSAYVNTPTLPPSFLDALNAGAALHRATGTKMAMQFSYDNAGGGPEPTLTTILGHIAQLKPFFTANADVIAVVHGGFLGTYGEWAFSTAPSVGNPTPSPAARAAVRDALLAAVDTNTHIGWRTLDDLKTWYPTPLNASQAFTGTNQARSGVHNDCFLSNKDDSGTYWAPGVPDTGRTLSNLFRAYHAQASDWTTNGGENCGDGEYKLCADVLYDGPIYHWRYLRDDWGTVFHDGWKAQGCYPEIERSIGYRFQLDAISHPQSTASGGAINIAIDLRNVGWAGILSARKLVVTLQNRTSGAMITGSAGDVRFLPSQAQSSTKIIVPVAIPAGASLGDYDVYVGMPDIGANTKDNPYFAVRFANADDTAKGQAWEAGNFRFKAGTMVSVTN